MKIMIIFGLLLSTSVFARQYIQCADHNNFERAVVNLDGEQSTLFMTNGVHLPDEQRVEILKGLKQVSSNEDVTIFKTSEGNVEDTVTVPTEIIGEYSNYFKVEFTHTRIDSGYSRSREMICYSALYDN